MIQILGVVGIFQSLQTLTGEVLLALGRAGTFLRFTLLWSVATIAALRPRACRGTSCGVATCYAVATVLVEPVQTLLTTRALGIPFSRFSRSLSGVVQATDADGDRRSSGVAKR